jgi:hypothetical protein
VLRHGTFAQLQAPQYAHAASFGNHAAQISSLALLCDAEGVPTLVFRRAAPIAAATPIKTPTIVPNAKPKKKSMRALLMKKHDCSFAQRFGKLALLCRLSKRRTFCSIGMNIGTPK